MIKNYLDMQHGYHFGVVTEQELKIHLMLHHNVQRLTVDNSTYNRLNVVHTLHHNVRDQTNLHPNTRLWRTAT